MKSYFVSLGLVMIMLGLLLTFNSWTNSYVVKGEPLSLDSFSVISPLIIGILIMGAIALLIFVSVEGNKK